MDQGANSNNDIERTDEVPEKTLDMDQEYFESKLGAAYRRNRILRFIYDDTTRIVPYPYNLILLMILVYLIHLIAYAQGGYLYVDDDAYPGFLHHKSLYHIAFLVLIPLGLWVLKDVYDQLPRTFYEIRSTSRMPQEKLEQRFDDWQRWLNDPWQFGLVIILIIIVLGNTIRLNVTDFGDDPYPNDFGDYPLIATVNLLFFIVAAIALGTIIWQLILMVRMLLDYSNKRNELSLMALHEDGAAGLLPVSKIIVKMNLLLVIFMFIPLWEVYMNEKDPLELGTTLGYVILVTILTPILFFTPMWRIHVKMKETLSRVQPECLDRLLKARERIMDDDDDDDIDKDIRLKVIENKIERASKYPTWPFDKNYLYAKLTTLFSVVSYILKILTKGGML